jgi:hypothetical protein
MASPRPGEQLAAVITDGVSRAGDAPGPAEATYDGLPRRTRRRLVVASMQRSLLVGGTLAGAVLRAALDGRATADTAVTLAGGLLLLTAVQTCR